MELRESQHLRSGAGGALPQGAEPGLRPGSLASPRSTQRQPRVRRESKVRLNAGVIKGVLLLLLAAMVIQLAGLWWWSSQNETTISPVAPMLGQRSGDVAELGVIYVGNNSQGSDKKRAGLPVEQGLLLAEVKPGGAADRAGLRNGDLLIELNGIPVKPTDSLLTLLAGYRPGDQVTLTVLRQNERLRLPVVLDRLK